MRYFFTAETFKNRHYLMEKFAISHFIDHREESYGSNFKGAYFSFFVLFLSEENGMLHLKRLIFSLWQCTPHYCNGYFDFILQNVCVFPMPPFLISQGHFIWQKKKFDSFFSSHELGIYHSSDCYVLLASTFVVVCFFFSFFFFSLLIAR